MGFEEKLWQMADKLRNNMDAAEYKHVVLGLIFLKYISDSFKEHHAMLVAGQGGVPGWAQTVIVNVTSVWPSAITHQTIWPTGLTMPLASSLNNDPGDIRPNLVMARIGYGGKISISNSSGSVDLIGDIVGWTG